jgi:hypothetical protein
MKLKNRSNLFLVIRENLLGTLHQVEVPIASFLTLESADEYAGVCAQEYEERKIGGFSFKAVPVIYYDM